MHHKVFKVKLILGNDGSTTRTNPYSIVGVKKYKGLNNVTKEE